MVPSLKIYLTSTTVMLTFLLMAKVMDLKVKLIVMEFLITSTPARCLMMNNTMEIMVARVAPSESYSVSEKGHFRIYRYEIESNSSHAVPRTHESTVHFAREATENFKHSQEGSERC